MDSNRTWLHDTAGSQHLALQYIRVYQASPLLCTCPACIFVWSRDLDNNKGNVSQGGLWPMVPASHPPYPLQSARVQGRSEEVSRRTGCPPLSETILSRRLRLFGHIARAGPEMYHCVLFMPPSITLHGITLTSSLPGIKHRTKMCGAGLCRHYAPVQGPLLMIMNYNFWQCAFIVEQ